MFSLGEPTKGKGGGPETERKKQQQKNGLCNLLAVCLAIRLRMKRPECFAAETPAVAERDLGPIRRELFYGPGNNPFFFPLVLGADPLIG